jgi:hypothetical protein
MYTWEGGTEEIRTDGKKITIIDKTPTATLIAKLKVLKPKLNSLENVLTATRPTE